MTVSRVSSLSMLDRCRIYSKNRMAEVSISEPDDDLNRYIDFFEKINPYDWGNDDYLLELVNNVFYRTEGDGEE